jgi:D-inositol-3-phosphate glycosyltransferase
VIKGWLDPSRQRARITELIIAINGEFVLDAPLTALGDQWKHQISSRTEWAVGIPAWMVTPWSRVEVFVRAGEQLCRLGLLLAAQVGGTSAVVADVGLDASLDLPRQGTVLNISACLVAGWAILDGGAPDRVEVFVGSEPPRSIRRGLPRGDLPGPAGHTCGFESVVPLSGYEPGQEVAIVVRATGKAGATWVSEPVHVRLAQDSIVVGGEASAMQMPSTVATARGSRNRSGPLRVVVFTHSLRLGGGQLHLQEMLLRMVASCNVALTVVAPEDGALSAGLRAAGIAVHITRGYVVDAGRYEGQLQEFAALLALWDAEVVMVNTLGVFAGVEAARQHGVPVAWTIHESFDLSVFEYLNWGPDGLEPTIRPRLRRALVEADAVVFETVSTLDMYAAAVPAIRAKLIRYGVDTTDIREYIATSDRNQLRAAAGYAPDDIVFVCMGVFEPRKAILPLIEAFTEAAAHLTNARLTLVGAHPAPYCDAVEQMIEARHLRNRVRTVPISAEIFPWYRMADFLVSASDIESLPRSMLEAMTFGVPLIACDVFGTGELVDDGVNGYLCTPNSHVSLVAAISRALRLDGNGRAEMGRRSARRVDDLGGREYHLEFANLLRRLAGRRADEE